MAKKDVIEDELNILSNDEIENSSDLQKALDLINKEQIIPEATALVKKNFIVKQNNEIKDLSKMDLEERTDVELDEIANQADSAFQELMDIAINSSGKACGDISAAAQQFLNIKLQTKLSKTELKLKRMKQELDEKKFEATSKLKDDASDDDFSDDGIVILNQPQ